MNSVNPALHTEALYSKSQEYIKRGLKAKGKGEQSEYQLWASFAVELLAKSSLSKVHPVLIADPSHLESLFAASGKPISPDVKTITAKTLYSRLHHVSRRFDAQVREFCEKLAIRRNSEIHSGETPFAAMALELWEGQFWFVIEILLDMQKKELQQWLGANDAKATKKILRAANSAVKMAVKERVKTQKKAFKEKYPTDKKQKEAIENAKTVDIATVKETLRYEFNNYKIEKCPSCQGNGLLTGSLMSETIEDRSSVNGWTYTELVTQHYSPEEFLCPICALHLRGNKELNVIKLDEEFDIEVEREVEFDDDYGND